MLMKFVVRNSCLVQPAEPTWSGSMPLSELDQIGVFGHTPTIYYYRPPQDWAAPPRRIFETLRSSLSKALVIFYPLAGRLRWLPGSRLELDCNGVGVQLTEVECAATLDDIRDSDPPEYSHLVPQVNYSTPLPEIPILLVQITKFRCGGVSLSWNVSHVAVDGTSNLHFLSEWAALARGAPTGPPPVLDRRFLRAGERPAASGRRSEFVHDTFDPQPVVIGEINDAGERGKETTVALLKLTAAQVEDLKREANRSRVDGGSAAVKRPYTKYESIVAHMWQCACKARRHAAAQPTAVRICVNVRKHVRRLPPPPRKYFGNAIVDVFAKGRSGEITAAPLGHAAARVREAIDMVTEDYVESMIDYLKGMKDFSQLQDIKAPGTNGGTFYGNPNLRVTSWLGLPLHGLDFGWGKEISMGPGGDDCDGNSLVISGGDGDGDGSVMVGLCLQVACMEDFKKLFYEDLPLNSRL
ncbi:spermidine hydroxycinnamoyl transferase-like [Andrographis paniculata]|uniref:spermidine hydroxycinnamoyl transferase-like n=1 Tax=Andrographis paniculata TaxID=175694 RepID=UPI0021E6E2FB|nr:spermidine hydroxycinnamoyl transferase-like [Andrographis paniculata]